MDVKGIIFAEAASKTAGQNFDGTELTVRFQVPSTAIQVRELLATWGAEAIDWEIRKTFTQGGSIKFVIVESGSTDASQFLYRSASDIDVVLLSGEQLQFFTGTSAITAMELRVQFEELPRQQDPELAIK